MNNYNNNFNFNFNFNNNLLYFSKKIELALIVFILFTSFTLVN